MERRNSIFQRRILEKVECVRLTCRGEGIFSMQESMARMVVHTGMMGWMALAMSGPAQYTPRM